MALSVSIPEAQRLDERVWKARLSPAEAKIFGSGANTYGSISIVLLTEQPDFNEEQSSLSFDPASVQILNLGMTDQAVFIAASEEQQQVNMQGSHHAEERDTTRGDAKFLSELPPQLQTLGRKLLSDIRKYFPGELKYYPRSRKFVETPDNFWTVRIQPRDKSLRITVRGRPETFMKPKNLELKPDMATYSSFKISSPEQLSEAIEILLQASKK
ncbi:hypothetical protein D6779_02395 [Candidatus Parcubacteria bacterium]|nr:MAG: hypothetical protein D6779_02395 [Candidatus Parcubacteria bacterium]